MSKAILPRRFGRHTGIRAWLANLELVYLSWKMDCLSRRITDSLDPYHSLNLSEDLDSTSVDAFLRQNTRFKSVRDVIEIQLRLLIGTDLNRVSMLFLLTYAKSQEVESFWAFLHGSASHKMPPMCVKNGTQQICQQLVKQCIRAENVILNQPISVVSFMNDDVLEAAVRKWQT